MNTTQSPLEAEFRIQDYYVVCTLSAVISLIAVVVSVMIIVLVRRTKPRLHTVRHLLMCNTSVASILYCAVQTMNYVFLIFLRWEKSDMGCRLRGYLAYMTICAVIYSFLIQSISRLFISIFSVSHKWLTTFRMHYLLILIQWFVVLLLPLPALITTDIRYRATSLCYVPLRYLIHVVYTYVAYYILPAIAICLIYVFIYLRVKRASKRTAIRVRSSNNSKRDLEVLRNILVFLIIYLSGGIPSILFLMTANKIIYLTSVVTISLTVAVEKICTILFDRDLRHVVLSILRPGIRILPLESSLAAARRQDAMFSVPQAR